MFTPAYATEHELNERIAQHSGAGIATLLLLGPGRRALSDDQSAIPSSGMFGSINTERLQSRRGISTPYFNLDDPRFFRTNPLQRSFSP